MKDRIAQAIDDLTKTAEPDNVAEVSRELKMFMTNRLRENPENIATLAMVALQFAKMTVSVIEFNMRNGDAPESIIDHTKAAIASMMLTVLTDGQFVYTPQDAAEVFEMPITRPSQGVMH